MKILKKLSAKTILGNVKKIMPKDKDGNPIENASVDVMRVKGFAQGYKTGESTFGPWLAYTGEFAVLNLTTGDVYASGILFLPDVASDLIYPKVDALSKGEVLSLDFTIGIVNKESSSTGYEFTVEINAAPEQENTLTTLAQSLLPAPQNDTAKDTKPVDKDKKAA